MTSQFRRIEGWRAREQREHQELLQAVLKRDGVFVLTDAGAPIIQVQGEHANTVGRKGRKSQFLRNETGVEELKRASAARKLAYRTEWIRRKRAANPGFERETKRRYRAERTPEQAQHDRLVASIYQQLLRLAGLAPWQRKSKAPDLCAIWTSAPASNNSDHQEVE